MSKKIPWKDIYKEFRSSHPNLRKNIIGWQPYGYLTILISFNDGSKMTYDHLTKYCVFVDE